MTFLILLYSDILIIAPGSKNTTPFSDDGVVDDVSDVLSTDDDDDDGGHDRVTFTPATLTFDDGITSLVYFINHSKLVLYDFLCYH